jgi:gluconate 2-dehydrogenase gamma chain
MRVQWNTPAASFFEMLLNLTAEGYFSDPANGGNRDALSWKMIGYDPGANRP